MKYLILCVFIIGAGFWIGRKAPVSPEFLSHLSQDIKKETTSIAINPESHSQELAEELRQAQLHRQSLKDLASVSTLLPQKKQALLLQVKNTHENLFIRRQVALTLRRHLSETEWRQLVTELDPRLKETLALSPRELLESYLHASR